MQILHVSENQMKKSRPDEVQVLKHSMYNVCDVT